MGYCFFTDVSEPRCRHLSQIALILGLLVSNELEFEKKRSRPIRVRPLLLCLPGWTEKHHDILVRMRISRPRYEIRTIQMLSRTRIECRGGILYQCKITTATG